MDTNALSSSTAAGLLAQFQISDADLAHVREYGRLMVPRLEEYAERFYAWLETQPEFELFFSDPEVLERVKRLQREYWRDFFRGAVDAEYVDRRKVVGEDHARIGLPLPAYFAAMTQSHRLFTEDLYDGSLPEETYRDAVRAVTRLLQLDCAIVVDALAALNQQTIARQSQALMEMSTPVTAIWEDILMLPVVGIIDSKRAQEVMNAILVAIAQTQSKAIIMDISGVAVVDTAVANHLIKITKATKLMGCECTISGVSPAIAQTMVELGIDVGTVKTTSTLKDALSLAFEATGTEIRKSR